MLESFITLSILFTVFAYFKTKKLGLLDPVPRDPQARVASYTSSVLSHLKRYLVHSRLEGCEANRVSYVQGTTAGTIWVESGNVHFQTGGSESTMPLGDLGRLTFALEGAELAVEIVAAEKDGAEHTVQVSLPLAG